MSKFSKLPYSLSDSHAASSFGLIHIDFWGPYKGVLEASTIFFLTTVDDHTKYSWVYLLQHKSNSLQNLKAFFNYVETHFSETIKVKNFFKTYGTIRQTSCVRRPQQNSHVERKHRHILEIARAFRFQYVVRLVNWGECVMTAGHIIYRLASPFIDNKTPYGYLYDSLPIYDHLSLGVLRLPIILNTPLISFLLEVYMVCF